MGYFQELPDLLYQSNLLTKTSSQEYLRVKNLSRKVKLTDQVKESATFFQKYVIEQGDRPDVVADKIYGDPRKDWVVVLTAGITNIRDEWPLDNNLLYKFVENKYGLTKINDIHHYETVEVRDNRGRLILPAGQRVDSNFTIPTPYDASDTNFYITTRPDSSNISHKGVNQPISPVTGISNFSYETQLNESKRKIDLMKPRYMQQFMNDIRDIMNYKEGPLVINNKLIATENTRLIGP